MKKALILISLAVVQCSIQSRVNAQSNSSTLTNSAAPSASSVTTGGSNLNYQTNSTFQNDFGFGGGVVCRTPSLYVSTNASAAENSNYTTLGNTGGDNLNFGGTVGFVVPLASPIIDYCKRVAHQTAIDKEISTQLSLIKACASLQKDGIRVDPIKFPLLEKCVIREGEPLLILSKDSSQNPKKGIATKVPTLHTR